MPKITKSFFTFEYMKLFFPILLIVVTIFQSSCQSKSKKHNTSDANVELVKIQEIDVSTLPLEECIKRGIYYLNEVDVATYDSISTQYFHQVIDYTDTVAIEMDLELEKLKYILEVDGSSNYTNEELDSIITKAHNLKYELVRYEKQPIGFVFVHTFLNKKDTMSAIILANSDLSKSEAIRIRTITDIEPNYFKQKIRNIEK